MKKQGTTQRHGLGRNQSWFMASRSFVVNIEARDQKHSPKEESCLHGGKNQSLIADRLWRLCRTYALLITESARLTSPKPVAPTARAKNARSTHNTRSHNTKPAR